MALISPVLCGHSYVCSQNDLRGELIKVTVSVSSVRQYHTWSVVFWGSQHCYRHTKPRSLIASPPVFV